MAHVTGAYAASLLTLCFGARGSSDMGHLLGAPGSMARLVQKLHHQPRRFYLHWIDWRVGDACNRSDSPETDWSWHVADTFLWRRTPGHRLLAMGDRFDQGQSPVIKPDCCCHS